MGSAACVIGASARGGCRCASIGCHQWISCSFPDITAGALVLRNIFSSYSLSLGDRVCLHSGTVQVISDGTSKDVVVQQFFDSMLNEINGRVESLRYVYERVQNLILTAHVGGGSPAAATSEILSIEQEPLVADNIICHGWLSALRHCVVEASTSQPSVSSGEAWRNTITKCAMTALSAFRAALIVVAETPSDVAFAPIPYDSDEGNASKGPVNANTYMFTNTNSFVGSVDGGQDDEDGTDDDASNSRSSAMQRAVVSAWLMVKESTALMVHLVELSEKESERKRNIDGVYDRLLAVKDVQEIGASLVDALHRLRHMGAISEAHFGLQSICTCLLR